MSRAPSGRRALAVEPEGKQAGEEAATGLAVFRDQAHLGMAYGKAAAKLSVGPEEFPSARFLRLLAAKRKDAEKRAAEEQKAAKKSKDGKGSSKTSGSKGSKNAGGKTGRKPLTRRPTTDR